MISKVQFKFTKWNEFSDRQKSFSFSETSDLIRQLLDDINQHDVFSLFVDNDIINLLALETNRYALTKIK